MVYQKELCREFKDFFNQNGVEHVMFVPYHPATNELVDIAVQTFKGGVKKGHIRMKLVRFLFSYWVTPQSTTGVSPAELMMERRLISALDLVKPDPHKIVERRTGTTKICM